jgi:hypothetical protein
MVDEEVELKNQILAGEYQRPDDLSEHPVPFDVSPSLLPDARDNALVIEVGTTSRTEWEREADKAISQLALGEGHYYDHLMSDRAVLDDLVRQHREAAELAATMKRLTIGPGASADDLARYLKMRKKLKR